MCGSAAEERWQDGTGTAGRSERAPLPTAIHLHPNGLPTPTLLRHMRCTVQLQLSFSRPDLESEDILFRNRPLWSNHSFVLPPNLFFFPSCECVQPAAPPPPGGEENDAAATAWAVGAAEPGRALALERTRHVQCICSVRTAAPGRGPRLRAAKGRQALPMCPIAFV